MDIWPVLQRASSSSDDVHSYIYSVTLEKYPINFEPYRATCKKGKHRMELGMEPGMEHGEPTL